jgi:hypothetical protein
MEVKVNLSLCLLTHHAIKMNVEAEVYHRPFLISEQDGEMKCHALDASSSGEIAPRFHWLRGWVGHRAGLATVV